jgi:DNA-binding NarL/FixJ family response regulator
MTNLPAGLATDIDTVAQTQDILTQRRLELENKLYQLKQEKRLLSFEAQKIKKLHKQIAIIETKQLPAEILSVAKMFPMITSTRELEVLYCMSKFLPIKQIADVLFVSPKTIKYHRTNIYKRTGLKGEKEILKYLVEHGQK